MTDERTTRSRHPRSPEAEQWQTDLGQQLRDRRLALDLSLAAVCENMPGTTPSDLAKIERGATCTTEKLRQALDALGLALVLKPVSKPRDTRRRTTVARKAADHG